MDSSRLKLVVLLIFTLVWVCFSKQREILDMCLLTNACWKEEEHLGKISCSFISLAEGNGTLINVPSPSIQVEVLCQDVESCTKWSVHVC